MQSMSISYCMQIGKWIGSKYCEKQKVHFIRFDTNLLDKLQNWVTQGITWNYIIWVIFISNQNKFQRLTTKLEFQFFHSLLWSWRQKCLDVSFSLCTWHGLFSVWFDTILIHVGMISSNKFVDLKHLWQVIYIFPPLGFIYAYTSYK